jgi:hypothetical protein
VLDLLWGTAWGVGGTARLAFGYRPAGAGRTVEVVTTAAPAPAPLGGRHQGPPTNGWRAAGAGTTANSATLPAALAR